MKHQALFSSKDKRKKFKMSSAAVFVWRFKVVICGKCINLNKITKI